MWLDERPCGVELRNYSTGTVYVDKLYQDNFGEGPCEREEVCVGSRMVPRQVPINYKRPKEKILQQAKEFLDGFFRASNKFGSEEHIVRLLEVHQNIEKQGSYVLTYAELEYGAQLAWRNAPRCIARVLYTTLKVFDARHIQSAREMFDCIIEHIVYATNQGRLRSVITVFPSQSQGQQDFRIWNSQLVGYAGYRNSDGTILGDPANAKFTELCLSLGWKTPIRTRFDILPVVLQVNGQPPEFFCLPPEIVLEVPLIHPTLSWFEELGLRWYSLPAVANMLFDCGGIQFPAAPFNGWYMGTEIGARDLCDPQRYNLSGEIAKKMDLDMSTNTTLWKDTVLLEVNKAVLYSYQKSGVTTWDHHTASESFMQFYNSEMKTRGGCPADWIWLVPPMSSCTSPLFHQEMALYFLKPSFEYQSPAWEIPSQTNQIQSVTSNTKPKKSMRTVSIAVRACVYLYRGRLAKRPKAVVLYASQSGKAEKYATTTFSHFRPHFQAKLFCMADYDPLELKNQQIILVVASTFGDGEAPTNGEKFKTRLQKMQENGVTIKSVEHQSPRFAVLGLGSNAYPQFCAYGKFLDNILQELGGNRLLPISCADELNNQEKTFQTWINDMTSLLSNDESLSVYKQQTVTEAIKSNHFITTSPRFVFFEDNEDVVQALSHVHRNEVSKACVVEKTLIGNPNSSQGYETVLVRLDSSNGENLKYDPGDHLAIFPQNVKKTIRQFEKRLKNCPDSKSVVQLQIYGPNQSWESFRKIPPCSFKTLQTRFLDLTSPPNQSTLQLLASLATDNKEKTQLQFLAEDTGAYNEWVSSTCPNVVEVLEKFLSVGDVDAAALISTLSILQPRYYSISSSPSASPTEIHVTASLLRYHTKDGSDRIRRGMCTAYLEELKQGDFVTCFSRPTPSFRLPTSPSKPLIWIAAGSGIAPFRGFWQQLSTERGVGTPNRHFNKWPSLWDLTSKRNRKQVFNQHGAVYFFYGCRDKATQLFRDELNDMLYHKVINKLFVAYSREIEQPKVHVQDLLWKDGARLAKLILKEEAVIYVCGGVPMASAVEKIIHRIIRQHGGISKDKAQLAVNQLKANGRYKTDIFGSN